MEQAFDYEDSKKFGEAIASLQKGLGLVKHMQDKKGLVLLRHVKC